MDPTPAATDPVTLRLRGELAACRAELLATARQLRAARERAVERDRVHDNFLRMISHELNTPISTLQLSVRLMASDPTLPGSPRFREGLERIQSSSERLQQLVETVTEWTRMKGGRRELHPEPIDLAELVAEAAARSDAYARRKGVRIEVSAPRDLPRRSCDLSLLRLLVENLVARAVQLSSEAVVEARVELRAGQCRVVVTDMAPPIRASEDLFDPLRSPTELLRRCGSGSGLALSVLRDLARALDGELAVEPGTVRGNATVLTMPEAIG